MFLKWECVSQWSWYDHWVNILANDHRICIFNEYIGLTLTESCRRMSISGQYVSMTQMVLFDNVEKLTKWYMCCLWPSSPTIRCMVGLEGLLRCKSVLNEVKCGNQVCTEGHDSLVQKWCPGLLSYATDGTKSSVDYVGSLIVLFLNDFPG